GRVAVGTEHGRAFLGLEFRDPGQLGRFARIWIEYVNPLFLAADHAHQLEVQVEILGGRLQAEALQRQRAEVDGFAGPVQRASGQLAGSVKSLTPSFKDVWLMVPLVLSLTTWAIRK